MYGFAESDPTLIELLRMQQRERDKEKLPAKESYHSFYCLHQGRLPFDSPGRPGAYRPEGPHNAQYEYEVSPATDWATLLFDYVHVSV